MKQGIVSLLTETLKRYNNSVPLAAKYQDLLVSVRQHPIQDSPHTICIRYFDEDTRQRRPDPGPEDNCRGPTTYLVEIGLLPAARTSDLISPNQALGTVLVLKLTIYLFHSTYSSTVVPRQLCVRSPSMEPTIAAVGDFQIFGPDRVLILDSRKAVRYSMLGAPLALFTRPAA